jgi:hypothetical protein
MRTEGRDPTNAERELGCACPRVYAYPSYVEGHASLPVLHKGGCPFPARPGASLEAVWEACDQDDRHVFLDWLWDSGELDHLLDGEDDVTPSVTVRACACGCGQPVTSPRPEARYATGACRVRAHRAARNDS